MAAKGKNLPLKLLELPASFFARQFCTIQRRKSTVNGWYQIFAEKNQSRKFDKKLRMILLVNLPVMDYICMR